MAIDRELRSELLAALKALPGIETFAARTTLLVDIRVNVTRSETDLHTDLLGMLGDLGRADPASLLVLVDNAIDRAGPSGAATLRSLRVRVEAATVTPPPPQRQHAPVAPPTATWDGDAERRLRGALAELYPTEAGTRLVCADIGLGVARIDLAGSAETRWFNAVTEARHQRLLDALLARALQDTPQHGGLRGVFG